MVPAACKGQKTRWEKIFYRNGGKCLKVFETIRRERENETSRDKGGVDFFYEGYLYVFVLGGECKKKKDQEKEPVIGTSRIFTRQNSYDCSKREGKMNCKRRGEKGQQTEERRTTLSVCSHKKWESQCGEKYMGTGGGKLTRR